MTEVVILDELAAAEAIAPDWDALAEACSRPASAPAWVLGFWRHLAGPTTTFRIIVVRDRGRLIGLAPFSVACDRRLRCDYRLPATDFGSELEPLAWPGREWEVAGVVAEALAAVRPAADVIAFEWTPLSSPWTIAMREQWPTPVAPYLRTFQTMGAPAVSLRYDSFDAWMADRSATFRRQMRRARGRLERAGGRIRMATPATLSADVRALVELHTRRWADRGPSGLLAMGTGLTAMLEEVGVSLLDSGRFQLQMIELEGTPIAAQLFLAAGDRSVAINGGWDPRYPELSPAQLNILHAIEHGFMSDALHTLSLGPGMHPYKLRFSDGNEPVVWQMLLPPRARMPLTAARVAPALTRYRVRQLALRALTPELAARVRQVRARIPGRAIAASPD